MANSNARYAYDYLQRRYNLTPVQAAGVVGNLMQESSMNTGARNPGDGRDGSDSIGLAQWNGGRAKALHAFAADQKKPVTDLDTQLDFVVHELKTTESAAFNRLKQADNVHSATAAMIGYERPQGWRADNPTAGHGWGNRLKHANTLYGTPADQLRDVKAQSADPNTFTQSEAAPAQPATSQPNANTQPTATETTEAEPEKKKRLINLNFLPDEIAGVKTKDATSALGEAAKIFTKQEDDFNREAAQTGGLIGGGGNVQVSLLNSLGAPDEKKKLKPWELQLAMLARQGGLGGLGGMRGLG